MQILFWLSIIAIFYAYFGYPMLMVFLAKIKRQKPVDKKPITPFVSIVIPAYNEEKNIGAKLNDILNLDYPKDKMEIYVVSDVSSDRTDEIITSFEDRGIKLFRLKERSGKIAAYRSVLPYLKGEIVIFSDATSSLNTDSITHLVSNFNDPAVGCVGGLLMYINPKQAIVGKGEKKYWSYENKVRDYESMLSSLPSVSGTFYAVRKNLYPYNMKDDLADDLMVPFNVVKLGYRTVFEKDAACKDFTTLSIKEEMAKRIRITIQNIRGLIDHVDILNAFKYGLFSLLVISHKLFRLLAPFFLTTLFVSSLFLSFYSHFYLFVLLTQFIFYLAAYYGFQINKKRQFALGNAMFYFCLSNYAIFIGFVKFFKGEKVVTWQTVRS